MAEMPHESENPARQSADPAHESQADAGYPVEDQPVETQPVKDEPAGEKLRESPTAEDRSGAAGVHGDRSERPAKPMSLFRVVSSTVSEFIADNAMTYAAAVAFYTALSFAPLLVVLLAGLSLVLGQSEKAQAKLLDQLDQLAGPEAAGVAKNILANADQPGVATVAGLIGLAMLIFSATGVFAQLQQALNILWGVKANPRSGILEWMRKRVLSLGIILAIGFMLLISLVISAAIQWFVGSIAGQQAAAQATGEAANTGSALGWLWISLNLAVSLGVFTMLFMFMFKYLPDAKIKWSDVWQGALVTAVLFTLGKWAIGKYLGFSSIGSAYGAAGSLVILLVWVYYSALILFVGAEFTQVWARRRGERIEPADYAVEAEQ